MAISELQARFGLIPSDSITLAALARVSQEIVETLLRFLPEVITNPSIMQRLADVRTLLEGVLHGERTIDADEASPWESRRSPIRPDVGPAFRTTDQEWILGNVDRKEKALSPDRIAQAQQSHRALSEYRRVYKRLETAYNRAIHRWEKKAKPWVDLSLGIDVPFSMMTPINSEGLKLPSRVAIAHPGVDLRFLANPALQDPASECCCDVTYPYCNTCRLWFSLDVSACRFHGGSLARKLPAHGHLHCAICGRPARARGYGSWTLCLAQRTNPYTGNRQRLGWVCNDWLSPGSHKQQLFAKTRPPDSWAIIGREGDNGGTE